ncbi:MAG: dimethyl sulfoxide reductase anchor subunit family protein, partial [Aestuariivirgaceae bacterium]
LRVVRSMHPAYSVLLFTTASGAGYGLLALIGLAGAMHGEASSIAFAMTTVIAALGLISVGLLSSTFHLGHPERAWRAFSQWRSSWLSREGVAAVVTFAPALLFAYAWTFAGPAIALWGILSALLCAVTVYCTGMIYASLPTIRQWQHPLVVPVYLVFALATGATLLLALAHVFGREQTMQVIFAAGGLAAALALKLAYWKSIDAAERTHTIAAATGLGHLGPISQLEMPHTAQNYLMQEMGYRVARKHAEKLRRIVALSLAGSVVFCLLTLVLSPVLATAAATLAVVWAAIGAVTERWLFFAEAEHVVNLYYGKPAA